MATEIEQLKELVLDEDFTSLQNLVNEEVNLMEILGVSRKELQHSNFLAWFFNPEETHNLGDFALKEFIKIYFKENQYQNLGKETGLSVFDFIHLDFDDLEIRREYKNIDLIFLSRKNQFCIVIENKIYSSEKKGQLEKYRNSIEKEFSDFKHKIYIYLSLEDQQITESEQNYYVQLNYDHIIKLIEQVISSRRLKIADKTRFVFEQYLQTLKSMLNKNEEIEKVAQQLYKKYKSAFDLVYKYAPNINNVIWNKIHSLIQGEESIIPWKSYYSNYYKKYLRFQPKFLHDNIQSLRDHGLISPTDDLTNNWMFAFEFIIQDNNQVTFACKIGSGDQQAREKLYAIYMKHKDVYTQVAKLNKLKAWHPAFQKEILSSSEFEDESTNIEQLIEKRFRELIDKDLPKLIEKLKEEINSCR
jgi:hypothetical protein